MVSSIAPLRNYAKRLREVELILAGALDKYEEYKRPKLGSAAVSASDTALTGSKSEKNLINVNVSELIGYAHRISYTTFAPPEFAQGRGLTAALPPAPQDEQMRASLLYQFTDEDLGIPKSIKSETPVESKEEDEQFTTNVAFKSETSQKTEPSAESSRLDGSGIPPLPFPLPPGAVLPPMPPGWKPGDPIPIPQNFSLPPMPPNWKPGDSVVIPPASSGALPPESKHLQPAARQFQEPPNESIGITHVPYVSLDLNSDLEESSDYTDSSDEEYA